MRQPTPEEWGRLEKALGITDHDPARRKKMLGTLQWAFGLTVGEIFGPYLPYEVAYGREYVRNYRRAHTALRKHAVAALTLLHEHDWRATDLQNIIESIDDIAPDPDTGGRPRDWPLHAAICKLAEIYTRWTGRKAGRTHHGKPGGPFFMFVKECLLIFAPALVASENDEVLHAAIRRALPIQVRPISP